MSPTILSSKEDFNEFCILLHKTIEKYSEEKEDDGEFSFFIPSKSLDFFYEKEKRLKSDQEGETKKIDIVTDFYYEPTNLKKISSTLGISSSKKEVKKTLLNIYRKNFNKVNPLKIYRKKTVDNILGLIVNLKKNGEGYKKKISRLLREYFREEQQNVTNIFLIIKLEKKESFKNIPEFYEGRKRSNPSKRKEIGKKILENYLPETRNIIEENKKGKKEIDFFYSSFINENKKDGDKNGFEEIKIDSKKYLYPYSMFVDMFLYFKDKCQNTMTKKEVMEQINH